MPLSKQISEAFIFSLSQLFNVNLSSFYVTSTHEMNTNYRKNVVMAVTKYR